MTSAATHFQQYVQPTVGLTPPVAPGPASFPLKDRPYLLTPELATSVNVAMALEQPLLVTGEPGCGKTALAFEVARQLKTEVLEFITRSTSQARDALYTVDTLRRFQDATLAPDRARDAGEYIRYGALGEAIRSPKQVVVLIDEIDKAPRDFPNDLLHEVERMAMQVPERAEKEPLRAQTRHFVLITSNRERPLPEAFLRRCVHAHIELPDPKALQEIVQLHTQHQPLPVRFAEYAVDRFMRLRNRQLAKPPSTAELIAWTRVIAAMGVDLGRLQGAEDLELPALGVLVKQWEDRQRIGNTP